MSEEQVQAGRDRAPWDWDELDPVRRTALWSRFATWVEWLEEAHRPWVVLPSCWALHIGLREELKVFWYWHELAVRRTADAPEAVRWHQDLRRSASAWRELSTCAHEAPIPQREALRAERRRRTSDFVLQASDAAGAGR